MKKLVQSTFIIPFSLPWDWSADYQKQTCFELAKKHKVFAYMQRDNIFFLKAFLKKNHQKYPTYKNICFYRPYYILPFQRFDFIEKINQILSFKMFEFFLLRKSKKVLWIFDPIFYQFIKHFKGSRIYDCVDFIWDRNSNLSKYLNELEELLIRSVDYFFVNSNILAQKKYKIRKADAVLPQGFRINDFKNPIKTNILFPKDRPIIGFVGAISYRFDFDLLLKLVKRNPQYNFIFWGPLQEINKDDLQKTSKYVNKLLSYKNVLRGNSINRREIPSIIKQFDVCIIPYDVNQGANRYCYTMKIFEYFYEGKPVVSTPIEELKRFPKYIRIGNNSMEWEKNIKLLLDNSWPAKYQIEERRLAFSNSWEKKITKILSTIQ